MTSSRAVGLAYGGLALGLALALAACAAPAGPTFPPPGVTPPPADGATAAALQQVIAALGARGLEAGVSGRAYRPPEAARLAAVPRTVVQVTLPEDPQGGQLVLYALGSPGEARAAAEEQAAYVAGNVGGIQFPPGSRFVLRVVGSTVVFYTWSPGASPDPRTPEVAEALATIGTGVPVES